MKILIVTPNEPFYLADNIRFLLGNISKEDEVMGCVLLKSTPYGKRYSFLQKAKKTYEIFGFQFFIYYTIKFIITRLLQKDVKKVIEDFEIPIIQLDEGINHKKSISTLSQYDADLIISILGNEIFKRPILDLPRIGCLNLHTSLLPKYRGMMPTFWAMLNEENEIGVSVFLMDEGIDTGPIITQKKIPITSNDTQKTLIKKTKKLGMKLILQSIEILKSNKYDLIKNNDRESSYFSYPTKEDVKLFLKKGKKFF